MGDARSLIKSTCSLNARRASFQRAEAPGATPQGVVVRPSSIGAALAHESSTALPPVRVAAPREKPRLGVLVKPKPAVIAKPKLAPRPVAQAAPLRRDPSMPRAAGGQAPDWSSPERANNRNAACSSSGRQLQVQQISAAFTVCQTNLKKLAAKILNCPHSAEDIVQDAYIKAIERSSTAIVRQPVAYVYQIVHNLAIDRLRRAQFESRCFAREEEGTLVVEQVRIPETIIIDRQHLQMLCDAISELPERTQCAFRLCMFEGHSQREVAKKFNVSSTLVNFMIRDAVKHCREAINYEQI